MRVKTEFPHQVREIENTWITLSDGCRLAVRLWLPEDADENPVPAVLEYLPYRKNDGTAPRDAVHHPYFAGHGYASVRVDMRGTGDSDGILHDEYLPQEQLDALEVLTWLEEQPWCTGSVGVIGISWGGFNGLQIAAHQPPQLKAVVSICSTDDRYADDVHYMGGCLLAAQMLPWASSMLVRNATPPDPKSVGPSWREMWLRRMDDTPPFVDAWVTHQRRDEFWKQGSVCEDFSAVTCPVYAVGGWADAYTNAVPRLLDGLPGPKKGLIGPWAHLYPEQAIPGPTIGFMQECVRWWDHWLKDEDTGIMDEPLLRVWMQDPVAPQRSYASRPGRWVTEHRWPSPNVTGERLVLGRSGLTAEAGQAEWLEVEGMQTTGLHAGSWCHFGSGPEAPGDQRAELGGALAFTSEPLSERLEVLGSPTVSVRLRADRRDALVAVLLCDVAPGGESTLVTRGMLNLTHRESHEHPRALEPGETCDVELRLNDIAYGWPPGHRLQLLISPTYWPWAWPSPVPVTLGVMAGEGSFVELPVRRAPEDHDDGWPDVEPAEGAAPLALSEFGGTQEKELRQCLGSGRVELEVNGRGGYRITANGLEYESSKRDVFSIVEGEPLSAGVRCERSMRIAREDWDTLVETTSTMSSTETDFVVSNTLNAYEGNVRVFAKSWESKIPRDHV